MNKIEQYANFEVILNKAFLAADNEAQNSSEDYYCGFAWVKIENGRSAFVNFLKSKKIGSKSYTKGYDIWSSELTNNKRVAHSQSMTLKENVSRAFAKVLNDNGIVCYMQSRAD